MKKGLVVQLFFLLLTLFISVGIYKTTFAKEDGAPSGNTGSPGDDQTCAHVDCHTGSATHRDSLISTDVPATGYLSTGMYLITVTINEAGISKFGFQASPQDLDGSKMGEIELINISQTKETGGGKYITHTLSGTTGIDTRTWTFNWTPEESTGDVTIYVAVNATDNEDDATGDKIFTSSITVKEDSTNIPLTIEELNKIKFDVTSPAVDELTLTIQTAVNSAMQIMIFDLSVRLVYLNNYPISNGTFKIPVSILNSGLYFVSVNNDREKLTKQFIKL